MTKGETKNKMERKRGKIVHLKNHINNDVICNKLNNPII